MDFTFSEEQQAAAEAARAVFSGVSPDSVPSPALTGGAVSEDFDRTLWAALADADLLSLFIAPRHGGAGLGPIALCLVLREAGQVLARVPLLESSAAAFALSALDDRAAARVLPMLGRGELVVTVASSGRTGHDPAELAVTARQLTGTGAGTRIRTKTRNGTGNGTGTPAGTPAGSGIGREAGREGRRAPAQHARPASAGSEWLLDGVQTAVPWAQSADRMLLPARTADGRTVLALVHRDLPGVTLADQVSTNGERYAEVRLDSARVGGDEVIVGEGVWERLRGLLTLGTGALALGVGTAVARMTGAYTSKREQFGFPIATFQAVAVQAADRYIDLRAMEATLWQAAWRMESGAAGALPVAADLAVAKIWASEGVRRVVQTAQHLHGGFGADTGYALHRYHAWAKQLELSLGPAAAHEEALGDLLAAHPLD
ncbi:acyl-CoA dehydrogenase family protein [Streptomyces sp. NPDC002537]